MMMYNIVELTCISLLCNYLSQLKRFLHDWNLMFFIGGLVVVDVLVLIVGTAVPSSRFVSEEVEDKEFPPTRNVHSDLC